MRANVLLDIQISGQVQSIVYAFVDPRRPAAGSEALACKDLGATGLALSDPNLNVVRAGFANFVDTQGTGYFPDTNLGAAPPGRYVVGVEGRAEPRGNGAVVAYACAEKIELDNTDGFELDLQLHP